MKHYKRRPAKSYEKKEPVLDKVKVRFADDVDYSQHPFSFGIIKTLQDIKFPTQVTFFIGENGTDKSTTLEAIACNAGFGLEGGSKNFSFKTSDEKTYTAAHKLVEQLRLSWRVKPRNGYFFRAESFFNIANYIDELAKNGGTEATYAPYGINRFMNSLMAKAFYLFLKIV